MNNWVVIVYTALCLITSACHKAEATNEEVVTEEQKPEHHCVVSLSKETWHYGTLCPKEMLSRGHGVNPKGQVVSGCVKLEMKCGE